MVVQLSYFLTSKSCSNNIIRCQPQKEIREDFESADREKKIFRYRGHDLPLDFFRAGQTANIYIHESMVPIMQFIINKPLYEGMAAQEPGAMAQYETRLRDLLGQLGETPETTQGFPSTSQEMLRECNFLPVINPDREDVHESAKQRQGVWMTLEEITSRLDELKDPSTSPDGVALPDNIVADLKNLFSPVRGELPRRYSKILQGVRQYDKEFPQAIVGFDQNIESTLDLKFPSGYLDPGEICRIHSAGFHAAVSNALEYWNQEGIEAAPYDPDHPTAITLQAHVPDTEELAKAKKAQCLQEITTLLKNPWLEQSQFVELLTHTRRVAEYHKIEKGMEKLPEEVSLTEHVDAAVAPYQSRYEEYVPKLFDYLQKNVSEETITFRVNNQPIKMSGDNVKLEYGRGLCISNTAALELVQPITKIGLPPRVRDSMPRHQSPGPSDLRA